MSADPLSDVTILMTELTGSIPFIAPKYWIEPRQDLRGNLKDWSLMCDAGCNITGFPTTKDAYYAAFAAGIAVGLPPANERKVRDNNMVHHEEDDDE